MATAIQLLRSSTPRLRPNPSELASGMPMVNIAPEEPGLYFRTSDYQLVKIGPTFIGTVPPNDGAVGQDGNTIGEQWLDVVDPAKPILKIWDGSVWLEVAGGDDAVQSDWNESDSDKPAFILNKPTNLSDFDNDLSLDAFGLSLQAVCDEGSTTTTGITLTSIGLTANGSRSTFNGDGLEAFGDGINASRIACRDESDDYKGGVRIQDCSGLAFQNEANQSQNQIQNLGYVIFQDVENQDQNHIRYCGGLYFQDADISGTANQIYGVGNIAGNDSRSNLQISNFQNIYGSGEGQISGFRNIQGDGEGAIRSFKDINGAGSGQITGYVNIYGAGGQLQGFTEIPALDTCSNVDISNAASGEILQWNGSSWGNASQVVVGAGAELQGSIDVKDSAPGSPEVGHIYVQSGDDPSTADASWTGIGGEAVVDGAYIIYGDNNGSPQWFIGNNVTAAEQSDWGISDSNNNAFIKNKPTNVSYFTNDSSYATTSQLPTNVSELTNDAGYITASDIPATPSLNQVLSVGAISETGINVGSVISKEISDATAGSLTSPTGNVMPFDIDLLPALP